MRRLVLGALLLAMLLLPAYAQNTQETSARGIFQPLSRPPFPKPIPASAAYFSIDPVAFDRLASTGRGHIIIPDFPVNSMLRGTLRMERFEVLTPDAHVYEGRAGGDREITIDPGVFLKGSVEEIPGSFVYLAVFRDYCSGYVQVPGHNAGEGVRFSIAPLELRTGSPSIMVIYNEPEALALEGDAGREAGRWSCGAESVPGYQGNVESEFQQYNRTHGKDRGARPQSNTLLAAQIALDCDSLFYVAHGRNLSRATNYALTVMGAQSAIYQRDLNVLMQVPFLRVWSGADPWNGTTTSTLLPQFRTYWINNMGATRRTLAQMYSGSSIGGGIAYLSALCDNSFGYAVCGLNNNVTYPTSAYVWDSDVTSHETGHNFGSPHTHSCNWAPAIDSCYTAEGSCFAGTNPRTGTIMSYCHLTAFGTLLNFHPRVAALMRTNAENANCIGALNNSGPNDVAVSDITTPASGGAVAQNAQFTPRAVFRNAGTNAQTNMTVTFTIRDSAGTTLYTNNQTIGSLASGATIAVDFTPTSLATVARCNSTVSITLGTDGFSANNTMVRPFEVVASVSGSVTVTAPNGGTIYRSGSAINITWTQTGLTTVRIDFSPDDGASWYNVRSDIAAGAGTLAWIVPPMATTRGRIRVANRDNLSTSDASDNMFTITTLPLDWQWGRGLGSILNDEIHGVATDSRGNVYVCGTFNDSLWLDTVALASAGGADGFVAAYTPGGWLLWARRFGGSGNDTAHGVAVDGNGNVFVTGSFFGTATLGGFTLNSSGDADVLVAKYDAAGTAQWATRAGSTGRDVGRAIALDNGGTPYIAGSFANNVTFGPSNLSSSGLSDAFIAHLTTAGVYTWAQRGGGASMDEAYGVGTDGTGNCAMVGRYTTSATFGATTVTGNGGDDGFVARYNSSGTLQWVNSVVGSSGDDLRGVAVESGGAVTVTGAFTGTVVNLGTSVIGSFGGRDVLVAKYATAGALQWMRRFGGTGDDFGTAISLDASGNAYVSGHFTNTMAVAELTVNASGGSGNDIFAFKLNPDGWPAWARSGGGPRAENGWGIVVNANGDNAYAVAQFSFTPPGDQPSIFGPDQLSGRGGTDLVIARLGMFRVTSPRDRDEWRATENRAITWTAMPAANVKLEYSIDDGGTWTTIIASTANTGTYTWSVPVIAAPRAMIRVTDADNPSINGIAVSGTFRIIAVGPPTNLTAVGFNASVDLTWTAPAGGPVSSYAIYRAVLPAALPGALQLLTTVAGTQTGYTDLTVTNCTDYVYAVKSIVGATESSFSNLDTARPEAPRTMHANNPLANEKIPAGSNQVLHWTSTGCLDSVRIELWTATTGTWAPITAAAPNVGVFSWSVPSIKSTHAMIRVVAKSDASVISTTDTFSICSATSSIIASGPTTLCAGDSVTLTAPAGNRVYLWSNGATTRTIVVRATGTFKVTVADSADCSATSDTMMITVYPLPKPKIAASGAKSLCQGDSVTLDAGPGFAAYVWSNGATGRKITVKQTGTFWARVSNEGGCAGNSDTVSVTVGAKPQAVVTILGAATLCQGDSVKLDAGAGFATYLWSTGATTPFIYVKQSGSYYVTIGNGGDCSATSTPVTVTVHAKPSKPVIARNASGDSLTYNGAIGTLTWTRNDTLLAGVTGTTIPIGLPGMYVVSVIDANGCSNTSDAFEVKAPPAEVLAAETGDRALLLHPNPASGLVTIETDLTAPSRLAIRLTDMNGRTLRTFETPFASGHVAHTIDIHSLPAGVYLVEIEAGLRKWTRKVVKQ